MKYLGLVYIFFIGVLILYLIRYNIKQTEVDFDNGFRSIILEAKKNKRGFNILKLTNGKDIFYLKDMLKHTEGFKYSIGDSIIKNNNSCSYYLKANKSIIYESHDDCYNIYISSSP